MYPDNKSNVSVSPLKVCFSSVDPMHNYYLQVWKNSITSSKTLQCPELFRVKYDTARVFPGKIIHGGGFLNRESNGNYRIQLHVYSKVYSRPLDKNNFCHDYTFKNVIAEQLTYITLKRKQKILFEYQPNIDFKLYHHVLLVRVTVQDLKLGNNVFVPFLVKASPNLFVHLLENLRVTILGRVVVYLQKYLLNQKYLRNCHKTINLKQNGKVIKKIC